MPEEHAAGDHRCPCSGRENQERRPQAERTPALADLLLLLSISSVVLWQRLCRSFRRCWTGHRSTKSSRCCGTDLHHGPGMCNCRALLYKSGMDRTITTSADRLLARFLTDAPLPFSTTPSPPGLCRALPSTDCSSVFSIAVFLVVRSLLSLTFLSLYAF